MLAAAVALTTVRLVASHAYAVGAPPGFSGGFKEESCHACHFDAEPNSGPGAVTIEGVPTTFAPGERYTLTITLKRASMKLAGFQLAARFKDSGMQAGTIAPGPGDTERVRVETQGGVQYAGHTKLGTSVGADVATWTIVWTAAKSGGLVTVHVSANAADGNDGADGDFVYTASAQSALDPISDFNGYRDLSAGASFGSRIHELACRARQSPAPTLRSQNVGISGITPQVGSRIAPHPP